MPYSVNITTTLFVQSTSKTIQANETQVNVTINLLNEGKAALAKQILVRYKAPDTWLVPNNYVILDHGNGTYFTSFTANIPLPTVEVSAKSLINEIYLLKPTRQAHKSKTASL